MVGTISSETTGGRRKRTLLSWGPMPWQTTGYRPTRFKKLRLSESDSRSSVRMAPPTLRTAKVEAVEKMRRYRSTSCFEAIE